MRPLRIVLLMGHKGMVLDESPRRVSPGIWDWKAGERGGLIFCDFLVLHVLTYIQLVVFSV